MKFWKAFPFLAIGSFIGMLILIALRIEYYRIMEYQPNMGPQIAYYFSPILLGVVLIVAIPIEAIFRKYVHSPSTKMQALAIGFVYATFMIWWAFPAHWAIFLLINPITVRWILGLIMNKSANI